MRKTHQRFHQALLEPSPSSGRDGVEQTQVKYGLLRRVRWFVIAAQLGVMYPAWKTGYLVDEGMTLALYVIIVASLALWNLQRHPLAVAGSIFFELSLDLLALSGLLVLTSGCQNPFFPLLYVGAILGPILLPRRWAVAYLFESALALTLICYGTEPDMMNASGHQVPGVLTVGVKVLVILIMGALALWLKTHLDQAQIHRDTLQKQRQKLNNLRVMGIVAGQLSHEIATPLNTMRLMLDRLQRKYAEAHELQVARAALEQCERSIRNLFETGVDADSLSFGKTELVAFVKSVCEQWQLDFPEVQLRFSVDAQLEGLSYHIPAAPFAQAVLDLLDNAKEASESAPILIHVSIQKGPEGIEITIADRGRGLDAGILARLGEPFVSTKSTGTGLGVYNATALLEALGGRLGLKPRQGGGTQVSMVLPL